ncbi:FHA domain-containing protein [Galactobacter sp.]|uniref:FHA domain-containing protein n=1 Tax=Galactobacter sp. TaxID=2676125 RepID=UPI0025BA3B1C|nr:FHA domain-containing protein [Galactobacter sp.]
MTEGQNQDPRSVERENAEATSVGLPRVTDEVIAEYQLSQEERAAVGALPVGSALLISHAGGEPGARFLLDSDVTTVGRHPESDIFLDDVTVSRRHARFDRGDDGFRVVDTGSLNGTYVNGDRVDEAKLRTGAEVRIGKFVLTFYGRSQAQA